MKRITLYLIYGTLLLFLLPGLVFAGTIASELEKTLANTGPDEEVAVIVTLADKVDLKKIKDKDKSLLRTKIVKALKDKAEKTQKPLKNFLKQNKAKKIKSFWVFNGLAVTVKADLINKLAVMDEIESISLDATLSVEPQADAKSIMPVWNLDAIRAPELWVDGITGTGIVLANMDSGVNAAHPDLAARWRGGSNSWYDPNGEHSMPYDRTGHGTQVMGVMVGGNAGGSSIGVAPGARWIAVKIFNDAGQASYSIIHSGFQWLLDPDDDSSTDDAPDVVNNSWGYPQQANQCLAEFQADVQALKAADIGVVFSAGNGGPYGYTSESPANYEESFAAGSVGPQFDVSTFSARGPSSCTGNIFPEVVAPGENIYTADLGNHYASVDGTSFAAPHIAAAMGLLLSADPTRSIADIESAMTASAQDLGVFGSDNDSGSGLLNVTGAYNWLVNNQPPQCVDEIKHDTIDQDCNGYDLTIDITVATYAVSSQTLTVEATSDLGGDAALELVGYGSMKWNRKKAKWTISVGSVATDPGIVTVRGVEGDESAATTVDQGGSSGGGKGGGKGKK